MAKVVAKKNADFTSFSGVNSFLSQFDPNGALLEDYEGIEPKEWINTGNYIQNAHYSGSLKKGYPSNKIIGICGDPKTGKSYLLYSAMREAQKAGYLCWLFETENSPDKSRFLSQKIDPKMLRITQPETVSELIIKTTQLTEELLKLQAAGKDLPKIWIGIDSLTGMNSDKQFKDALIGDLKTDMGTVAREIKLFFNMIAPRAGKLQIPIYYTAHVYEKDMGSGFKKKVATGGSGGAYMASVLQFLRKSDDKEKDDDGRVVRKGITITSNLTESRFSAPRGIELYVSSEFGLNPYYGLHEYFSWENCGIDKGKFIDLLDLASEMLKKKVATKETLLETKFDINSLSKFLSKPNQEAILDHLKVLVKLGDVVEGHNNGVVFYTFSKAVMKRFDKDGNFTPLQGKTPILNKLSPNWIVEHLGTTVTPQEVLTPRVITDEVIDRLDEIIKPLFSYGHNPEEPISIGEVKEEEVPSGWDAFVIEKIDEL